MGEIRFSPAHIWVLNDDGARARLGVSDYLQEQLGAVISVELPDIGDVVRASRRMGKLESDEATSPLEAPVTGEVIDVNPEVLVNPELVNQEPYESGWLLTIRLDDPEELDQLMSEEEYVDLTTEV
jgi:glycine cleavage system H protein